MGFNSGFKGLSIKTALRGVSVKFVVEKPYELHILSVCLHPHLSSMRSACAVLYCRLLPVRLYNIFPHYNLNGSIFEKKVNEHKICVLIFSGTFLTFLILRRSE